MFGRKTYNVSAWQEIGQYRSTFYPYSGDIYANDVARSCVRALAEHTSKANVKVIRKTKDGQQDGDQKLQRLIQDRPNYYMNGKDFLYKVRTRLEIDNTVFIFIRRDDLGRAIELYPIPKSTQEAVEVSGQLYIKFTFSSGQTMAASWEDLAILRKDYNLSDIWGDSNSALTTSLELLDTTNQGMANAIKATANLRGILKTTKAMLKADDAKKLQEQFVSDFMGISNTSGIGVLDSTQDFIPINLQPQIASYKSVEELRNNIYRYFGVNEDILTSKAYGDAFEAFYESRLEPFLLALGLELTNKLFTPKERGFGNEIIFEANRLAYASQTAKMSMVSLVDRGILTINEYREVLNLSPVEGGDVRVIRKEYAEADKLNEVQGVDDSASQSGSGVPGNEPAPTDNGQAD